MRFVETKTADQQSGLVLHRTRHLLPLAANSSRVGALPSAAIANEATIAITPANSNVFIFAPSIQHGVSVAQTLQFWWNILFVACYEQQTIEIAIYLFLTVISY